MELGELIVKVRFLPNAGDLYGEVRSGDQPKGFCQATAGSAGVDLRAAMTLEEVVVPPSGRAPFPTGVAVEPMRPGAAGFVFSRSGLGARDGLTVAQGVGLIDPDYRGEIVVWLLNTSEKCQTVKRGDRIAQLVHLPYFATRFIAAETLSSTDRGAGGFGHTGAR